MNLSQIEAFCTVADKKCITDAAQDLHLTQPALSRQIRALEESLQVQLLRRSHQGVELTEAGEIVYEYSKTILELVGSMNKDLESLVKHNSRPLIIGASTTLGNYALPCSVWTFKEKNPGSNVILRVTNTEEVLRGLLNKTVDIGVIEGPVYHQGLVTRPIARDELVLITPPEPLWREKVEVTLDEVRQMPLVVREPGSGTRKSLESLLQEIGLTLSDFNVVMELNSTDAIKSAVQSGRGVSILSRLSVRKELQSGVIKAAKIRGVSFVHSYTIVYDQARARDPLQSRFIAFMRSPKERGFC
ncbi:MAG: selenium metabolism-associated LysR family transcriptional regulator [Firmicutes bacterium]|nr:selenium metabolism-associated LysR family transcriptional regulator [Bacillota bacterium]MCL5038836.1 selenium metabolism-associated LysR family transcriptional regulator [Bacillota bacterium]